jgi:hypothetical protein
MSNKPKSFELLASVFYDLPDSGEASIETLAEEMEDPIEDVIIALDQLQKINAIDVSIDGLTVFVNKKDGHRIHYTDYSKLFTLLSD